MDMKGRPAAEEVVQLLASLTSAERRKTGLTKMYHHSFSLPDMMGQGTLWDRVVSVCRAGCSSFLALCHE